MILTRVSRGVPILLLAVVLARLAGANEAETRARLVAEADKFERGVSARGMAYTDPELTPYLAALFAPLASQTKRGADHCRLVVLREPSGQSFALANGTVYLSAGAFARLEGESALSSLLAQKLAELDHEKLLQVASARESGAVAGRVASIATTVAAVGVGSPVIPISLFDNAGASLGLLYGAHLDDDAVNHTAQQWLARAAMTSPRPSAETFPRATARVRLESLRLAVAWEQYPRALEDIQRELARGSETAQLRSFEGQCQLGMATSPKHVPKEALPRSVERRAREQAEAKELARLRVHEPEQLAQAAKAFRRALELDPAFGPAKRGLGEVLLHQGDRSGAKAVLDEYLASNPQASDARYVKKLASQPDAGTGAVR